MNKTCNNLEQSENYDKNFAKLMMQWRRLQKLKVPFGWQLKNWTVYIFHIFVSTSSSSSSCCTISMNIPDPLLPPLPIVHSFWQVFWATSHIGTELLYVGLSWSSCLCSSMWKGSTGVHHMSSSLLLQQGPACLVHLILIVFVMGGWWPYSSSFVGCCLQDLFNIARSILV